MQRDHRGCDRRSRGIFSAALRSTQAGCAAHCKGTWADAGDVECDCARLGSHDPQDLAARVQRGLRHNQKRHSGSNILLHDGGHRELGTDRSVTLAAVGLLLDGWAGSGLRFVTVDAWDRDAWATPCMRTDRSRPHRYLLSETG